MATDQEVIDARKQINDNIDIEAELTNLAAIIASSEPVEFFVKRGGIISNFSKLKSVLDTGNANELTMISDVEAAVLAAIGPDEITVATIRKALRDLISAHDVDIAAT